MLPGIVLEASCQEGLDKEEGRQPEDRRGALLVPILHQHIRSSHGEVARQGCSLACRALVYHAVPCHSASHQSELDLYIAAPDGSVKLHNIRF